MGAARNKVGNVWNQKSGFGLFKFEIPNAYLKRIVI